MRQHKPANLIQKNHSRAFSPVKAIALLRVPKFCGYSVFKGQFLPNSQSITSCLDCQLLFSLGGFCYFAFLHLLHLLNPLLFCNFRFVALRPPFETKAIIMPCVSDVKGGFDEKPYISLVINGLALSSIS